jgi:hypothetical protein
MKIYKAIELIKYPYSFGPLTPYGTEYYDKCSKEYVEIHTIEEYNDYLLELVKPYVDDNYSVFYTDNKEDFNEFYESYKDSKYICLYAYQHHAGPRLSIMFSDKPAIERYLDYSCGAVGNLDHFGLLNFRSAGSDYTNKLSEQIIKYKPENLNVNTMYVLK